MGSRAILPRSGCLAESIGSPASDMPAETGLLQRFGNVGRLANIQASGIAPRANVIFDVLRDGSAIPDPWRAFK